MAVVLGLLDLIFQIFLLVCTCKYLYLRYPEGRPHIWAIVFKYFMLLTYVIVFVMAASST